MKKWKLSLNIMFFILLNFHLVCNSQNEFKKNVYHRTSKKIKADISGKDIFYNRELIESKLLFSIYELQCIGNYQESNFNYDLVGSPSFSYIDSINHYSDTTDFRAIDAKEFIKSVSSKSQIFIINENHNQPRHRVFLSLLLKDLFENGFRYLAVEALINDQNIDSGKILEINDGYYTIEPQFSNMIKEAHELGFKIKTYEVKSENELKDREYLQAKNIKEKILDHDSLARVVIFCGFDHLDEFNNSDSSKIMMAGWLKILTGIDPITVNQEVLSERSDRNHQYTSYSFFNSNKSSVFCKKNDTTITYKPFDSNVICDFYVYHPKTTFYYGRPNWLRERENISEYFISNKIIKIKYPVVLSAYKSTDDVNFNIPIDCIEIKNKKDIKPLFLKKGDYKLVIRNDLKQCQIINIHF